MTNDELKSIFKANLSESEVAALRGVYNAGWYAGAAQTPSATSVDKSLAASKPTAIVQTRHTGG